MRMVFLVSLFLVVFIHICSCDVEAATVPCGYLCEEKMPDCEAKCDGANSQEECLENCYTLWLKLYEKEKACTKDCEYSRREDQSF